jgi:4-hydroxybenzoate polyprenyltransferase
VHQWVKNLLLAVPAVMGHTLLSGDVLQHLLLAFFAFSFTASAVYVLNDLVDIDSDRVHRTKRRRPFAAGALPLWLGFILVPVLLGLAFIVSPPVESFPAVLLTYFALTTLYSFFLKQIVLLDIFTLASLYTIRIFAGSIAAQTPVSPWLLAFSVFLFLSLACVKRASELFNARKAATGEAGIVGRGYITSDFDQISRFGSSAGYLAVLVLALYINSPDVTRFYSVPQALWFICAAMLYWVSRVWLLTSRGELHEDPIVFALKDPVSYLVAAICSGILFLAL